MAFRRDGTRTHAWKDWLSEHRDELTRAGIPDWVLADELCWVRFLEHDGWDDERKWNVGMLTPQKAQLFASFVRREYGEQQYRGLLFQLEKPNTEN